MSAIGLFAVVVAGALIISLACGRSAEPSALRPPALTPEASEVRPFEYRVPLDNAVAAKITSYEYRQENRQAKGVWTALAGATGSSTSAILANRSAGRYRYQIRAVGGAGGGAKSEWSNWATVSAPRPAATPKAVAPAGLWLLSNSGNQIRVQWPAPSNAAAAKITKYQYQYQQSGSSTNNAWVDIPGTTASSTSGVLTAPDGNRYRYRYRIRAVGAGGNGAESGWSIYMTAR